MQLTIFAIVYVGMILGGLPRLKIDRTGVALLGAMALVITEPIELTHAVALLDVSTLVLLFSMMVLSAQLRLGGFYTAVTRRFVDAPLSPRLLLACVVAASGLLSAIFTNDIIALAMASVLVRACRGRRLHPMPFLLALACATNVGSGATLIGNPQNILVGQVLDLSFRRYLAVALLPSVVGLAAVWLVVDRVWRGRLRRQPDTGPVTLPADVEVDRPFNGWHTAKGLALAGLLLCAFALTDLPRDLVALGCAAIVLTSRSFHTREMLGLVDWELLVLFIGLFVVNGAMVDSGLTTRAVETLAASGVRVEEPVWLAAIAVALSNAVSNVPAVMLLLPAASAHPLGGPALALASTLAGNLLVVGSLANIIVVNQAARHGEPISWLEHARVGVPVTILTLSVMALTFWAIGGLAG